MILGSMDVQTPKLLPFYLSYDANLVDSGGMCYNYHNHIKKGLHASLGS